MISPKRYAKQKRIFSSTLKSPNSMPQFNFHIYINTKLQKGPIRLVTVSAQAG